MLKYPLITLLLAMLLKVYGEEGQTPWKKETVQGFPVYKGKLETTEGFGAYIDFCLRPNSKNFDNGGGTHDYNSEFLNKYLGVKNFVYDPYQRDEKNNQKVLAEVAKHDFDTATSNSVLNVIDDPQARYDHILLSCKALNEHGIAYFKVFPGDCSQIEVRGDDGYQSNRPASTYQEEVEEVFGKGNVVVDISRNMLIAYKNSGCQDN